MHTRTLVIAASSLRPFPAGGRGLRRDGFFRALSATADPIKLGYFFKARCFQKVYVEIWRMMKSNAQIRQCQKLRFLEQNKLEHNLEKKQTRTQFRNTSANTIKKKKVPLSDILLPWTFRFVRSHYLLSWHAAAVAAVCLPVSSASLKQVLSTTLAIQND